MTAATAAAPPSPVDQEFAFAGADFERVRQLIYQRAGISLHAGKQAMVYSRLSRRLRETRPCARSPTTCGWLERAGGADADAEWQEFVNCLTTNLTSFFREEHHFHALVEDLRARAARPSCASGATPPPPARSPTRSR